MKTYVLDTNALLHFLEGTRGSLRVAQLLKVERAATTRVLTSVVNCGEAYYVLSQKRGPDSAKNGIAYIARAGVLVTPVDLKQALQAAEIKARHHIPSVDSLTAALALSREATLVTSDRDFEKLGRNFSILWLPHT